MKVDELRVLEADELTGRLKTARRELYELRFKHAVGQLENWSQIAKVRHDIARILTVVNERELGIRSIEDAPGAAESLVAPKKPRAKARSEFVEDETAAAGDAADEAAAGTAVATAEPEPEPAAEKPKRTRRTKAEKDS
jgi:large subunit ribosomal protein L29